MAMKDSMRRVYIGLPLAILWMVGSADAAEITPRCPSPASSMLFDLMHKVPDAIVFELRGNEAERAIELFNSMAPQGRDAGDRFYIAFRPDFPFSRLMIASHGCIETSVLVDLRIAVAIKRAVKRFDESTSY